MIIEYDKKRSLFFMQMIYCKENNEIQIISYYWEKYKYLEWTEHETLIVTSTLDISFVSLVFYLPAIFLSFWSFISSWIHWEVIWKVLLSWLLSRGDKKSGKLTQNKFVVTKSCFRPITVKQKIFESNIFEWYFPRINLTFSFGKC